MNEQQKREQDAYLAELHERYRDRQPDPPEDKAPFVWVLVAAVVGWGLVFWIACVLWGWLL